MEQAVFFVYRGKAAQDNEAGTFTKNYQRPAHIHFINH